MTPNKYDFDDGYNVYEKDADYNMGDAGPVVNKFGTIHNFGDSYGDGGINNGGHYKTTHRNDGYDKADGKGRSTSTSTSWSGTDGGSGIFKSSSFSSSSSSSNTAW